MNARSQSSSRLLHAVLFGPLTRGSGLSPQDLDFAGYVVSLTPPGLPRMPNGIECEVKAGKHQRLEVGDGRLVVGRRVIEPGPEWNPVPGDIKAGILPAGPEPPTRGSLSSVAGVAPAADHVLAGYIAGLVLLHRMRARAAQLADARAARTGPAGATLLRHAALGEVPEVVHIVLATGDIGPLLSASHVSGHAWLRGLVSAGYTLDVRRLPATPMHAAEVGR